MNEDTIRMAKEAGVEITFDPTEPGGRVFAECWLDELERFAALVAAAKEAEHKEAMRWDIHSCGPTCKRYACVAKREAVAAEREAIMDEWWACVQSDLENGVKSLNERAAEKWKKEDPAIAGFAATIEARGKT